MEILLASISLFGTLVGSLSGVLVANRLSNYRISQLEKKVDSLINSTTRFPVVEEQIKVINHRISHLENNNYLV